MDIRTVTRLLHCRNQPSAILVAMLAAYNRHG
jgi:hypothetical protein